MSVPYKVLEINIISAQDLPPVSKMLRTFVVAWVNPDNKLTTKVDHNGHTNPTWNYKIMFRVDDNFLRSESSAVSIEIYNVAWLRDLPIGTTRLQINQITPPITNKNPATRSMTLHIRRPSGHLQGLLHVSVNLVGDTDTFSCASPTNDSCLSAIPKSERLMYDDPIQEESKFAWLKEDDEMKPQHNYSPMQMQRSKSARIQPSDDEAVSPLRSIVWSQTTDEKSKCSTSPIDSLYSAMKPLPTEVALNLKKGFDSPHDVDSGIFENWTAAPSSEGNFRSVSERKPVDDRINLLGNIDGDIKIRRPQRKKHTTEKKGLFSCFGNAYGFEFTFVCGSKNIKKSKKKKHDQKSFPTNNLPEENLRTFYI